MVVHASNQLMDKRRFRNTVDQRAAALCGAVILVLLTIPADAAPEAELWARWEAHDARSTQQVDHSAWETFLDVYLITNHPSGVNRVAYGEVTAGDMAALDGYIAELERVRVSGLNRDEQLAYWVNLYNAATVQLILNNYPVDSIRDIKQGVFSSGPWDMELLEVEGEAVTLNDVEHRIIRPIWQDPRIHYVVNCASYGCPNLYPDPLSAENWDRVFEESARSYTNHPRGVRFDGNRLLLSSIFDWYMEDFGGNLEGVIEHLSRFVDQETASRLRSHSGRVSYEYDWSLNEP
jgi:hypothetical protein